MSELASCAHVSRSTLYSHYANTREVFIDAVGDFWKGLRPLNAQLRCGKCAGNSEHPRPFCIALREPGKYEALVKDPSFLPTLLDMSDEQPSEKDTRKNTRPQDADIDEKARRALFRFQMSGCYAVAMDESLGGDWPSIQEALDAYIRAGIQATR